MARVSRALLLLFGSACALRLPNIHNRRQTLRYATAGGLATVLDGLPAIAATDKRPVLVLGANGGTGLECVNALIAKGQPCIAATRSGDFVGSTSSKLLTVAQGDVTSEASLNALIKPKSLSAVIYAASSSRKSEFKESSNAKKVDKDGVVTCSKVCIANEVPRMVLVSSGGVSKPTSAVYLFLNVAANGIMDAKISGENEMRRLYAQPGVADAGVGYTVVRPGGLTREDGLGVSAVELNQGDDKSGRIARADVASICIESLSSPAAFDTTFECYYSDTAKGLNEVFASNGFKSTDPTTYASGRERRASSWPALFEGLEKDRV